MQHDTPGASVSEIVQPLARKLESLPEQLSIELIQNWLKTDGFTRWMAQPTDRWPLARISRADADRIGSNEVVAKISSETMAKQIRKHPELTVDDYIAAQQSINRATQTVQETPRSLIFLRDDEAGHLIVVKTTLSGDELFVTSLRRMSANPAERARLIRQYLRRAMK